MEPVVPDQHHFYRKFDSSLQLFGLCVLASANTPLIVVENEVMVPGDVLWTNHIFEDAPLCTTHVCHCMRQPPSSPPPAIAQDDSGADNVCLNEEACRAAATALGYVPGLGTTPFVGQWTTKGCYAYDTGTYAGHAFFGTCGGTIVLDCTVEQMQTPVLANQKRIDCYAPPSPPPSPPPPSPPPVDDLGYGLSTPCVDAAMAEANPTYESQCRHWAEAQSVTFSAHYVEGKGPYGHCVQYIGDLIWGFNNGEGVVAVNKGGIMWSNSHVNGICSQIDRACHCVVNPPAAPPPASPPLCSWTLRRAPVHTPLKQMPWPLVLRMPHIYAFLLALPHLWKLWSTLVVPTQPLSMTKPVAKTLGCERLRKTSA